MKSKTSFFEPALLWNFIRRFWPLWLVYLVLTLVNLPVALVGNTEQPISTGPSATGTV